MNARVAIRPLSDTTLSAALLRADGTSASWRDFLAAAGSSDPVGEGDPTGVLTRVLARCPFEAFFFEARPVARAALDTPFEWVLVESPALAGLAPDPRPFAEHGGAAWPDPSGDRDVLCFDNLGRDARLVVPCRRAAAPLHTYTHLAAFVRGAPADQVERLWRTVGLELAARLERSDEPLWLSTSGLGVAWVHVRIDERPKYVTHAPYRRYRPPPDPGPAAG